MDFTDDEMRTVAEDLESDSKPVSKKKNPRVTQVMQEFERRLTAKEAEDREFLDLLQMQPPESSEIEEDDHETPVSLHSDLIMNDKSD